MLRKLLQGRKGLDMKKTITALLLALTMLLLVTAGAPVCFAEEELCGIALEQADIAAPEVNAYVYPLNKSGDIMISASEANTQISAVLGGENLTVSSFGSAKDDACCYIVVLNTSSDEVGYESLRTFKESINKWLEKLNNKDRFILITASNGCEVLLDGSESRSAAQRIVENISATAGVSDVNAALDEAIRISAKNRGGELKRHILTLYDKGAFLTENTGAIDQLNKNLLMNDLPLYFICTRNNEKVQEVADEFAKLCGGRAFSATENTRSKATEKLIRWLNGCYVVRAAGQSNSPEPSERVLTVTASNGSYEYSAAKTVLIARNIPDTEAPGIVSVRWDEEALSAYVVFSEDVLNADRTDNYLVEPVVGGEKVNVKEAVYSSADFTATVKFGEELLPGEYTLSVSGVTDTSYEANPLAESGGYTFTYAGEEELPILYIAAAAGAVVLAAVIIILVLSKKKKKRKEAESAAVEDDPVTVPAASRSGRVDISNGMPVRLGITMPNGLVTKNQITVGSRFVVGRSAKSNLRIEDKTISSSHLILTAVDGRLIAADNGSTNGTFVNGVKLDRPRPLNSGDKIHIGNTDIVVEY